ncbi:hypothetical protein CVT24_011983 [Panaeolus cyanescens]|uniref:Uncharacterized protein n=1 Tax=Panaeolus cyanescens TaxID=181874 RepID=A0A409X2X7_9AGAR|nr:hypothetical protein CVT24_011983 [Panaeolus cyanescens]
MTFNYSHFNVHVAHVPRAEQETEADLSLDTWNTAEKGRLISAISAPQSFAKEHAGRENVEPFRTMERPYCYAHVKLDVLVDRVWKLFQAHRVGRNRNDEDIDLSNAAELANYESADEVEITDDEGLNDDCVPAVDIAST